MSSCVESKYKVDALSGYGRCGVNRFGKKIYLAHVLAWVDANGRLPAEGMQINHTCHNRACINPEHLYEGTQTDNMRDMVEAGRSWQQKKTHFKCGCEKTPENTYTSPGGKRTCRKHRQEYDRKYGRKYYQANKDKIDEKNREYDQANKERKWERGQEYYEANKEKIRAQHRLYYEANKEKIKEKSRLNYQRKKALSDAR